MAGPAHAYTGNDLYLGCKRNPDGQCLSFIVGAAAMFMHQMDFGTRQSALTRATA